MASFEKLMARPKKAKRKPQGQHTHLCCYCRSALVCRRVLCNLTPTVPCATCAAKRGMVAPKWQQ